MEGFVQLKFNRGSYEKKGLFGSKTLYTLEALVDLTPEEVAATMDKVGGYLQFMANGGDPTMMGPMMRWASDNERKTAPYAILQLAHTERLAKTGITIETENMVQIQEAEEGIALGVKAWKTYAFAGDNFAKGTERIIDI